MGKQKIDKLSGLVVITGASSGIGLELAKCAARDGVQLVLAADRDLTEAEQAARSLGARSVECVQCDLATDDGYGALISAIAGRPVDVLMANAGTGGGGEFLDQPWDKVRHIIETNVTSTTRLVHEIGQQMRSRDAGRILVTGSIAGHLPGAFQLVYNSTKAFIDDFCAGFAEELRDTNVVVTCLWPGATDTPFFERAHMEDTKVGKSDKADPAKVAEDGYEALLDGESKVISGFMNKVQSMFADILPDSVVAAMHRRMAEPDSHKAVEERREAMHEG